MLAENTFDIGTLANMFGVSYRTLRFYEERGLICPSRQQRRRAYSANDRARLGLVIEGKRLGLKLREIEAILQSTGDCHDSSRGEKALESLIDCKQLEEQLDIMHRRKTEIESAIDSLNLELRSRRAAS